MAGPSRVPFALLQTLTSSDLSAAFRLQGRDFLEALRYLAEDQPAVLGGLLVTGTASGVSVAPGVLIAPYSAGGTSAPQEDESLTVLGLLRGSGAPVPVPVLGVDTWYTIEAQATEVDTHATRDINLVPTQVIVRREAGVAVRARVGTDVAPPAAAPGWIPLANVLRRAAGGLIAPADITDTRPLLSDVAVDRLLPGSESDVLTTVSGHAVWQPPAPAIESVILPAAITVNLNNYEPPGWSEATVVRLYPTGATRVIQGLSASAVQRRKVLDNVGTFDVVLASLAGGQSAGNQIRTQGAGYQLAPGSSVEIFYDESATIWRVLERDLVATANYWPLGQIFGDAVSLSGAANELSYVPLPRTRTVIIPQTSARPKLTGSVSLLDAGGGVPFGWLGGVGGGTLIYGFRLPHGAQLLRLRAGIYNAGGVDITLHAYQFTAVLTGIAAGASSVVDLGSETVNIVTTTDIITHAIPSPPATDGALHNYCVEVELSVGQVCAWLEAQFADPGPRNH